MIGAAPARARWKKILSIRLWSDAKTADTWRNRNMADTAKSGGCTTDMETMDFAATARGKKVLSDGCSGKAGGVASR